MRRNMEERIILLNLVIEQTQSKMSESQTGVEPLKVYISLLNPLQLTILSAIYNTIQCNAIVYENIHELADDRLYPG